MRPREDALLLAGCFLFSLMDVYLDDVLYRNDDCSSDCFVVYGVFAGNNGIAFLISDQIPDSHHRADSEILKRISDIFLDAVHTRIAPDHPDDRISISVFYFYADLLHY